MPIVAFSLKDLEREGYPKAALEELVPKLGIEIEGVDGDEVKLGFTPNRPDLLDFTGLIRAFDNFTGKRVPAEAQYRIKNEPALTIGVTQAVKKVRPYIAGIVARDVNLKGNRLKYMINFTDKFADTYGRRRKKLAIGIHHLEAIKGNLVYDAASEGTITPLNEKEKMSFEEVMRETAKGQEYSHTITGSGGKGIKKGGKEAVYPYLKDDKKTIALIPIINSEQTRVKEEDTDIFVDITGTSANAVASSANLIACSLIDMGADIYPVNVLYAGSKGAWENPSLRYREMKVLLSGAERTLGVHISESSVIGVVNKMGYFASQYGKSVLLSVPPYRVDVIHKQDIIEDMAIGFGYDKIQPLPISGSSVGLSDDLIDLENRVALLMVGLGYTESINSMLTNETINFDDMVCKYDKSRYVSLADSKSLNISMLRTDLLPGLLQDLSISTNERMPQRLFEVGKVFNMADGKVTESVRLAFVSEHSKTNFGEAKSVVEAAVRNVIGDPFRIKEHKHPSYIDGRCAAVVVNDELVGIFGELHPAVLECFKLEEPAVACELTLVKEMKYEG